MNLNPNKIFCTAPLKASEFRKDFCVSPSRPYSVLLHYLLKVVIYPTSEVVGNDVVDIKSNPLLSGCQNTGARLVRCRYRQDSRK